MKITKSAIPCAVLRPLIIRSTEPCCDVRPDGIRLFQPIDQVSPIPQPLNGDAFWRGDAVEEIECQVVGNEERRWSVKHQDIPSETLRLF